MLEFAVLGLLNEAPMHGYELRKRLNAVLGRVPGVLLRLALPDAAPDARARLIAEGEPDPNATRRRR